MYGKQNDFDFGPKLLFKGICAGSRKQRGEKNVGTTKKGSVE